jgi:hypothetical protein
MDNIRNRVRRADDHVAKTNLGDPATFGRTSNERCTRVQPMLAIGTFANRLSQYVPTRKFRG